MNAATTVNAKGRLSLMVTLFLEGKTDDRALPAAVPSPLDRAMKSFFNDVADLDRELFHDDNCLRRIELAPMLAIDVGPALSWESENAVMEADLGQAVNFAASCLAFSYTFADRRQAVCVSFQFEYGNHLRDYLALAAIQDSLLTELGEDARADLDASSSLSPVMVGAAPGQAACRLSKFILRALAHGYQRKVALARSTFVFEDPVLFDALAGRDALLDAAYRDLRGPSTASGAELAVALKQVAAHDGNRYAATTLARWASEWSSHVQALIFMSGFSQGVIDFLRQDCSEVDDGSEPLYPAASDAGARKYWILYANESAVIEVVRSSRSVESARTMVATCPYLLLVHLLAIHNEALTLVHDPFLRDMIGDVSKVVVEAGPRDNAHPASARDLGALVNRFREAHIADLLNIECYFHDNVFRYDTERAFFAAIEGVRGTERRRRRWADVMARLAQTIDEQARALAEVEQSRLNLTAGALAIIGLFSIALSIPQPLRDWKLWPFDWPQNASHIVFLMTIGALVWVMWRTAGLIARLLNRINAEYGDGAPELPLLPELRKLLLKKRRKK
jgi:hypothetical protein